MPVPSTLAVPVQASRVQNKYFNSATCTPLARSDIQKCIAHQRACGRMPSRDACRHKQLARVHGLTFLQISVVS